MNPALESNPSLSEVRELLDEIESVTEGLQWSLLANQAFAIVDASAEEYARFLYARRLGELPSESFDGSNVEQLIDFLEQRGASGAGRLFAAYGIYFGPGLLLDWLEFFQSVTVSRLLSREVDRELLETAIAGAQRFESAADFYCRALFDPEELKNFACRAFLSRYNLPDHEHSRGLLLGYLQVQVNLRVLVWEDLEAALHDALYERAVAWGFLRPEQQARLTAEITEAIAGALVELEFARHTLPSREALRKRYRALLRRFHPDLNPEGLEKTRRLIEAYTTIVRALPG